MKYWFYLASGHPDTKHTHEYTDVADAMAAFSKAISDGEAYGSLEFLREAGE